MLSCIWSYSIVKGEKAKNCWDFNRKVQPKFTLWWMENNILFIYLLKYNYNTNNNHISWVEEIQLCEKCQVKEHLIAPLLHLSIFYRFLEESCPAPHICFLIPYLHFKLHIYQQKKISFWSLISLGLLLLSNIYWLTLTKMMILLLYFNLDLPFCL